MDGQEGARWPHPRLVLAKQLGEGVVTGDYPAEALRATLEAHFERPA